MWHLLWDLYQACQMQGGLFSHLLYEMRIRYKAGAGSLSQSLQLTVLSFSHTRHPGRILLSLQPVSLLDPYSFCESFQWALSRMQFRFCWINLSEEASAGIQMPGSSSAWVLHWFLRRNDQLNLRLVPREEALPLFLPNMLRFLLCKLQDSPLL